MLNRISTYLYRHPRLVLGLLLGPPMLYMGVVYLGSLFSLLINSFFYLEEFTGLVVREFTLQTYAKLLDPTNLGIFFRTATMALLVTIADAIIAFPLAYYIARFAPKKLKTYLYIAVTIPLWSSYLVRVYAWKLILAKEGIVSWFFNLFGLQFILDGILSIPGIGGSSLSLSPIGMFIAFCYIWLPYMIVPIQTALERVPKSLLEASSDLGANPSQTFRQVLLPLSFPGVVAGSIFTFSLTLGDFIIPQVLGNSRFFIGQAVYSYQGTAGNIPLAAAFTMGPIVIMVVYLLIARKLGAFDAL
ncbi:MAG TPA: ABC transporter permease [Anaerolineales bacterium]|nr:ABC transporter permease [Anaerolineales bacterium]HND50519.1 ABC transporter permease [Anaerolineales bacterium]HNE04183.1 ABC transporter permease [Anaerolineales bacterium]HNM36754.1 ABC transporter permease [Anaerolineales bacterium]HNO94331.1 ABC transporter permease [Anaerolineales bacterium]